MPKVKRDMTINDVAAVVDSEGMGYAIQCYLSSERIKDKKLREAWQRAYQAMAEIEEILGSRLNGE